MVACREAKIPSVNILENFQLSGISWGGGVGHNIPLPRGPNNLILALAFRLVKLLGLDLKIVFFDQFDEMNLP